MQSDKKGFDTMAKSKWRKTDFRSMVRSKEGPIIAMKHSGWTDGDFNYYKGTSDGRQCWHVIDPMTGLSLTKGVTKEHAYEMAHSEKVQKDFEKYAKTELYTKKVSDWYKLEVKCGAIMENPIHN